MVFNQIDNQPPGKILRARFLRLTLFLALVAAIFQGSELWGSSGNAGEQTPDPIAAGDGEADKLPAKNGNRIPVKLIPDQRAIIGSPKTPIDLVRLFAGSDFVHNAQEKDDEFDIAKHLTFEVEHNTKKKYVEAEIVNGPDAHHHQRLLVLDWKKVGKTDITVKVTNVRSGKAIASKLTAEVWEPDWWQLLFTVVGGLGIFLLGMKNMSEGLQAIAGSGLRRIIEMVTDNRFLAIGVGATATAVVQSSSITTVMVVGFVNSGFMQLTQAIGVIMGANIGTTITGWILTLKIGKFGLPLLGVGAFGYLFSRRDRLRYLFMLAMGLGMVFLGLEIMKNGFTMVKSLPAFEAWFNTFDAKTRLGVLQCVAVGCILTFIVQSSSATMGITMGLAHVGVIEFDTAVALVVGENVGTTITAVLASFGSTTNARRAAYFHVLFNLVGVFWVIMVFHYCLPGVKHIATWMNRGTFDAMKGIALAHTCFNVTNTLVFIPFMGSLAKLLIRSVPERAAKEVPHLTSLDVRMLETPVIAIEQSRVEVLRMADGCDKMMGWLRETISAEHPDETLVKKLFHREEVLDAIQDEIVAFMTNILAGSAPHDVVEEGRRQLRMADEYESVSDYITGIQKFHLKLRDQGHRFDDAHQATILKLHELVHEYLRLINEGFEHRRPEVVTKANSVGSEVKHRVKSLRDKHLEALSEEKMSPFINVAYMSTLNAYRRVGDHVLNIAEALAGEK
ncbi:MAG: sodium:phosphate symporter [Planctomycetaceae bacterium]|nr:sodium:phosphate symporter [Planctomycetaceae bacterium]